MLSPKVPGRLVPIASVNSFRIPFDICKVDSEPAATTTPYSWPRAESCIDDMTDTLYAFSRHLFDHPVLSGDAECVHTLRCNLQQKHTPTKTWKRTTCYFAGTDLCIGVDAAYSIGSCTSIWGSRMIEQLFRRWSHIVRQPLP